MYRGDRAYSPWWTRLRILSSVLAALSFQVMFILALLKMDGHTSVVNWSWKVVLIPAGSAFVFFLALYCMIHYFTRHTAFTYTSDAAASYLLGIRTIDIDGYHQVWVFRDVLLITGYALLCSFGIGIATLSCTKCNTPYSLLSIGGALLYFLRIIHTIYLQIEGWKRLRLMILEIGKFHEFLDQTRLFNFVLPDLHQKNKLIQKWISCFLFMAIVLLGGLGSIWVANKNCVRDTNKKNEKRNERTNERTDTRGEMREE